MRRLKTGFNYQYLLTKIIKFIKNYIFIIQKNFTNFAIFEEVSEPGEDLIRPTRPGKLETPPNFHTGGSLGVTRLAYLGQQNAKTATPRHSQNLKYKQGSGVLHIKTNCREKSSVLSAVFSEFFYAQFTHNYFSHSVIFLLSTLKYFSRVTSTTLNTS